MKRKTGSGVAETAGIVTESALKQLKISYLTEQGFRRVTSSWVNGTKRIRGSLVEDSEIPLSVMINIIDKSTPRTRKPNAPMKKQSLQSSQINKPKKTTKRQKSTEYRDALDYRLPGSFGTGKRR